MRIYDTTGDRAGFENVLRDMRAAVRRGAKERTAQEWTKKATAHVPPKATAALASALFRGVRSDIFFEEDPAELFALVRDPWVTLRERRGNCIDQSVLLAAALTQLGIPWRFVTQGTTPDDRWHVYVEAFTDHGWYAIDPTLPGRGARLGARAPSPQEWRTETMVITESRFGRVIPRARPRLGGLLGNLLVGLLGGVSKEEAAAQQQLALAQAQAAAKAPKPLPAWVMPAVAVGGGLILLKTLKR